MRSVLSGRLGRLVKAVGGVSRLASMLQVDRKTLRRWNERGGPDSGPAQVLLEELYQKYRITPEASESARTPDPSNPRQD